MRKKPKLGNGKRFKNLKNKLRKKGVKNPDALSAWIGRKKYGAKKFEELAQEAKKRKKKKRKIKSKK